MSTDLPLEEPGRELTSEDRERKRYGYGDPAPTCAGAPAAPPAPDAYGLRLRPWDAYFAVVWLATVVFTLSAPQPDLPVRLAALGFFALLVPWYLVAGRRTLGMPDSDPRRPERAVRYIVGAVVPFVIAAALVGETRLATFALGPQCFMLLTLRQGLMAVTVINVVPVTGWALLWRPPWESVFFNSLFALVALTFSAVMGAWVIRIIDQSIHRADLIAELAASREEIVRLSAVQGALAERERMSREIHDTLAQGFTSLLMLVQAVEAELDHDVPQARRHLGLMAETARQNLAEARALVAGRAPADLDEGSLPDALRRLAARHEAPARVEVTGRARPVPAGLEVVALRSCQEALANVRKHAGAGAAVTLTLDYADDALTVGVRDTGCGFVPAEGGGDHDTGDDDGTEVAATRAGYGLRGLRARAVEVGGRADVFSVVGEGTTVIVRLPVPVTSAPEPAPEGSAP
ncbi:sensor histidine kinase [Streptomyces sp. NPDC058001]|uniref:sensor histidine kinase n=1 Tax=Streptomyces sp. NPDC058001 TaxID=3346300 RepID=UPI0036E90D36